MQGKYIEKFVREVVEGIFAAPPAISSGRAGRPAKASRAKTMRESEEENLWPPPLPAASSNTPKEQQRFVLTEGEAKALVHSAGIATVRTELARTAEEAIALARDMDFPVCAQDQFS